MKQERKRPELLLAAAALLLCAGVLVFAGAAGAREKAAQTPTGVAVANPFDQTEHPPPAQQPQAGTEPLMDHAQQPQADTQSPVDHAQPPQVRTEPPSAQQPPAASAPEASKYPVNINTANQAQLETLPGIGPAKAQAILDWRTAYGAFTDVYQLIEVKGIGEKTLEKLLPYVTV